MSGECEECGEHCVDCNCNRQEIETKMEWIKVEDKLPKIGSVVLLYQTYPTGTLFNCRADPLHRTFFRIGGLRWDGEFLPYENQYSEHGMKYITHWMPLPSPPKKTLDNS